MLRLGRKGLTNCMGFNMNFNISLDLQSGHQFGLGLRLASLQHSIHPSIIQWILQHLPHGELVLTLTPKQSKAPAISSCLQFLQFLHDYDYERLRRRLTGMCLLPFRCVGGGSYGFVALEGVLTVSLGVRNNRTGIRFVSLNLVNLVVPVNRMQNFSKLKRLNKTNT
jgi:hypothetical protein